MAVRDVWEIRAVSELQDIVNRIMGGKYKSVQELAIRLYASQKEWERLVNQDTVELSGLTFPVDPDGQP